MSFMPFQPIQPLTSQLPGMNTENLAFGQEGSSENHEGLPFGNYLEQAMNGVNNSILDAGGLYQKAVAGKASNLHQVTIASAEAEVLLKLATGITSKITTAANTLFQMQF